jgi:putative spermidine/putrescine transport system ATP-binding protein
VTVLLRPESIGVRADEAGPGEVVTASFLGSVGRVQVRMPDGGLVLAQVATSEVQHLGTGTRVALEVRPVHALAVARD